MFLDQSDSKHALLNQATKITVRTQNEKYACKIEMLEIDYLRFAGACAVHVAG